LRQLRLDAARGVVVVVAVAVVAAAAAVAVLGQRGRQIYRDLVVLWQR